MSSPTSSPKPLPTGFMVLHSNRMEGLRDLMVEHIQRHPLPPLAAETILVQSNGMKHWLSMALASDDALGICAATRMVLPSSQLWQIYRTVLGVERLPMHMPLDKAPLAWRILRKLPQWLDDPRYAVKTATAYAPTIWRNNSPMFWTATKITVQTGSAIGPKGWTIGNVRRPCLIRKLGKPPCGVTCCKTYNNMRRGLVNLNLAPTCTKHFYRACINYRRAAFKVCRLV